MSSSVFNLRPDLEPILTAIPENTPKVTDYSGLSGRKERNRLRKNKNLEDKTARQTAKKRERKLKLAGVHAALPPRMAKPVRGDFKTVKSMGLLAATIKDGFKTGFAFPDVEVVPNDEAENLCGALHLQGTQSLDASRIQAFMLALLRACKNSRAQYEKGVETETGHSTNSAFSQAVAQVIHRKGVYGGGLHPRSFPMTSITADTCKAMLVLFVDGRKAYLRHLVESQEVQEGVYTNKIQDLIAITDYWIKFAEGTIGGQDELVLALGEAMIEE